MPEQEDSRFKVTDRRKFKADGTPREDTPSETDAVQSSDNASAARVLSFPGEPRQKQHEQAPASGAEQPAAPPQESAAGQAEQAYDKARGHATPGLPEASFLGLLNMLGVEAAMHLGLIRTPGEEAPPLDLESARHLIDLLGVLRTKTRGNLTPEEDNLFENMLADLRIQFVETSKRR